MMRRLIAILILVLSFSSVQAQDNHEQYNDIEFEHLQEKVDSLNVLKRLLQDQLTSVTSEIDRTEALLDLHEMEGAGEDRVVLVTNMEASLRSRPSPDGQVIRILPEKTLLIAQDYNGVYWKVKFQGIEGWVMRLFVDEDAGAKALKQKLAAAHDHSDRNGDFSANKLAKDRIGKEFLVTDFGIHPPNTAGGVSVYYAFEHLDSTRTVREVTFSITPFNAEGLKERGANSGTSTKRLRRFGPISVEDGEKQYHFENVWYNDKIRCAQLDRVDIVYTNGSRVTYRQDVDGIIARTIDNDCELTTADQIPGPPDNE